MVNWNRRSRFSQIKNKRQSLRRGGAPPRAPAPPSPPALPSHSPSPSAAAYAAPIIGRDGSLCLGQRTEKDCTGNAAMRKTCQWHNEYSDAKGKKHAARCQGKAAKHVISEEGKGRLAGFEAQRAQALRDVYSSSEDSYMSESDDSEMGSPVAQAARHELPVFQGRMAVAAPRARASKKAPTPAQLRRAEARASGVKYVPVMSPNAPMGCVQKQYNQLSAKGNSFVSTRCVDSKDPNENDLVNCRVNPETNKCKKVDRA
jgi:hypothetical protein